MEFIIAIIIIYFIFRVNWKKLKDDTPTTVNQDEIQLMRKRPK